MNIVAIKALSCAIAMGLISGLTGCGRSVTSTPGDAPNLEKFVQNIKNEKPKDKREPLPLLLNQEVFSYADHTTVSINPNPQSALERAASNPDQSSPANQTGSSDAGSAPQTQASESKPLRSPFDLPQTQTNTQSSVRPDSNRPKQALEGYALDSLKMVGTIGSGAGLLALVQSPDKVVYRVGVGQYMGQADGRVTSVNASEIRLVELVSDGAGGWVEQPASLVLSE